MEKRTKILIIGVIIIFFLAILQATSVLARCSCGAWYGFYCIEDCCNSGLFCGLLGVDCECGNCGCDISCKGCAAQEAGSDCYHTTDSCKVGEVLQCSSGANACKICCIPPNNHDDNGPEPGCTNSGGNWICCSGHEYWIYKSESGCSGCNVSCCGTQVRFNAISCGNVNYCAHESYCIEDRGGLGGGKIRAQQSHSCCNYRGGSGIYEKSSYGCHDGQICCSGESSFGDAVGDTSDNDCCSQYITGTGWLNLKCEKDTCRSDGCPNRNIGTKFRDYGSRKWINGADYCEAGDTCTGTYYERDSEDYNDPNLCCQSWLGGVGKCCGDDVGEDFVQPQGEGVPCCYNAGVLSDGEDSGSILCSNGQMYDCNGAATDDSGLGKLVYSIGCTAYEGKYCSPDNSWKDICESTLAGTLTSTNLLSGQSNVARIDSFSYTASSLIIDSFNDESKVASKQNLDVDTAAGQVRLTGLQAFWDYDYYTYGIKGDNFDYVRPDYIRGNFYAYVNNQNENPFIETLINDAQTVMSEIEKPEDCKNGFLIEISGFVGEKEIILKGEDLQSGVDSDINEIIVNVKELKITDVSNNETLKPIFIDKNNDGKFDLEDEIHFNISLAENEIKIVYIYDKWCSSGVNVPSGGNAPGCSHKYAPYEWTYSIGGCTVRFRLTGRDATDGDCCQWKDVGASGNYRLRHCMDDRSSGGDYDTDLDMQLYVTTSGDDITVRYEGVEKDAANDVRGGFMVRVTGEGCSISGSNCGSCGCTGWTSWCEWSGTNDSPYYNLDVEYCGDGECDCGEVCLLDCAATGTLTSTNLLSGQSDVGPIRSFSYTASSIPSGTSLKVQFSQDSTTWYDSTGVAGGWDVLTQGSQIIDLSGLGWSGANFYYKMQFHSDASGTPVLEEINVDSALLPSGTSLKVQFSQNSSTWYNSTGVEGGLDNLTQGSGTIDLSGLGWSGANFYYKMQFHSDGNNAPGLDEISVNFITGQPPVADICCQSCTSPDCTTYTGEVFTLINNSSDPDGDSDIVKSIWDILNREPTPDLTCTPPDALCDFTVQTQILGSGDYTVQLYVEDLAGASDTTTKFFTIIQDAIADFKCSLDNSNWQSCGAIRPSAGAIVYFQDQSSPSEGASITKRAWTFQDGNPANNIDNETNPSTQFQLMGSKQVSLTTTDSAGRIDSRSYAINVSLPLPEWREISPF